MTAPIPGSGTTAVLAASGVKTLARTGAIGLKALLALGSALLALGGLILRRGQATSVQLGQPID